MQHFVAVRVDYANTPVFRVSPTSGFRVDVSNRAQSSFSSSSVIECLVRFIVLLQTFLLTNI
jgi:hypothetical protein